jgi:cytochrome c peroxidase
MRTFIVFAIASLLAVWIGCKPDPKLSLGDGHAHTHYNLTIPAGLPPMKIPADNPMTVEGVALGRQLFYDNILSKSNTMNCGSCHQLKNYFVDSNKQFSTGIDNIAGSRNGMSLFNIGYSTTFFWDGGAANLEAQVLGPITNPIEMHETMTNVLSKLQSHPNYPSLFYKAFGTDKISSKLIFNAIAQFERTMISANSKFDHYLQNKINLTEQELRGKEIYLNENKGDCFHCHSYGSTFTDYEFRNTGLDSIPIDLGRNLITHLASDEGKFKTPSLRNIAMTSPYMHDGRFTTLRQCIEHYNRNFKYTQNLSPELKAVVKNRMSEAEIDDLIAFLNTLTDVECIANQNLVKP